LTEKGEIDMLELDLLLRNPQEIHAGSPLEFLNEKAWGSIKALSLVPIFHGLDRDIETSSKQWKKYVESEASELEKPPVNLLYFPSQIEFICLFRANGKVNPPCNNYVFFVLFDLIECFMR